jgi:predicted NAD/FAD-binding protein
MRIAVVGSGIAGLTSAWLLSRDHDVVLYEADSRIGGHTCTVSVGWDSRQYDVDTGFIVYNPENYPNFARLLERLGVATRPSNMSFSVRDEQTGLEYSGSTLAGLFAQSRNLVRPGFFRMLVDIMRFYRDARELVHSPDVDLTVEDYATRRRYSAEFREWHLYPMTSAIWSTGRQGAAAFPAAVLARFFYNHGFLQVRNRPQWRVLEGGSKAYLEPITRPFKAAVRLSSPVAAVRRFPDFVRIRTSRGHEDRFHHVVLAAHSDQTLRMLEDPSPREREILGAIRYTANEAVLHTDENLLPKRHRAWASWNCHLPLRADNLPSLTYFMNSLQSIPGPPYFCVTLNRTERIAPSRILARMSYAHPVYDAGAIRAQRRKHEICGINRTSYCGAYWGYGFHEDGVVSALDACRLWGCAI